MSGVWMSARVGKMLPSAACRMMSGTELRGSAAAVLMKKSQYGSSACDSVVRHGSFSRPSPSAMLDVPLDESIGVLFQGGVVPHIPLDLAGGAGVLVRRGAASDGTRVLAGLDAGVVTDPAHPRLACRPPELVVDRLQHAHERGPEGDRTGAEGGHGEA